MTPAGPSGRRPDSLRHRAVRFLGTLGLVLALLAVAHATFLAATPGNIDDAFIVLVYARHWLATGDYFYSASQVPLDGFTSILDLWIKSAAIALSGPSSASWPPAPAVAPVAPGLPSGPSSLQSPAVAREDVHLGTGTGTKVGPGMRDATGEGHDGFRGSARVRPAPPAGADPVRVAWMITVAYHMGAILVALWLLHMCIGGNDRPEARLALVLGGVAAASCWALAEGASFLLETPLAVALVLAAMALALDAGPGPGKTWALAGVLVLLFLARPEGLAVAPLVLALAWRSSAMGRPAGVPGPPAGSLGPATLAVALLIGAYVAWHQHHFGWWAPNTYYAKTADRRLYEIEDGLAYVASYMHIPIGIALTASVLVFPIVLRQARFEGPLDRFRYLALAGMALAQTAIVVVEGGDCYKGERFLAAPAMTAIAALALAAGRARGAAGRAALAWLALVAAIQVHDVVAQGALIRARLADQWPLSGAWFDCEREAAVKLAALIGTDRAAQVDYQRLKYYADALEVVDLDGLNDRAIAHEPSEGHVTFGKFRLAKALEVDPAVFVYGWKSELHAAPMAAHSLSEVIASDALREETIGLDPPPPDERRRLVARYRSASVPVCGYYFNVLVRADLAQRFSAGGVMVGPP